MAATSSPDSHAVAPSGSAAASRRPPRSAQASEETAEPPQVLLPAVGDTPAATRPAGRPEADRDADHYRVLLARDARFDGRLFVGVRTTGVYCRPICRVRTPKAHNCRFFTSAAQAEAAAFRPCLKCRPELAPGPGGAWTVMDASRTLARQAATLLDSRAADGDSAGIAALAERLGVSERHLRRIFLAEHGVTPLQYLQTRRLLLAKQLLTDTALPVAQVALASGYRSLRRFNAAFVDHYRLSPSRLRERRAAPGAGADDEGVRVGLAYRPPLDRARLLGFFAQRAIPGVEQVLPEGVRRSLRAGALSPGDGAGTGASPGGWVEVLFDADRPLVTLRYAASLLPCSGALLLAVRRWLDLDAQPEVIDAALADLPGAPGLRLPGGLDAFELAVRAVLGQQVTVAGARTLARRLVDAHGTPLVTPWPEVQRAFPSPERLAALEVDAIASLGIVRTRAQAILALARAWPRWHALLAGGGATDALVAALCGLPGIGSWTAHYLAMRVLGWPDAFPPGDVAVLKALRLRSAGADANTAMAPAAPTSAAARRAADAAAEAWRPWRSYAVLRLWDSLGSPSPHEKTPGRSQVSSSPSGGLTRSGRPRAAPTLDPSTP